MDAARRRCPRASGCGASVRLAALSATDARPAAHSAQGLGARARVGGLRGCGLHVVDPVLADSR
jgi:hypothetical protein